MRMQSILGEKQRNVFDESKAGLDLHRKTHLRFLHMIALVDDPDLEVANLARCFYW